LIEHKENRDVAVTPEQLGLDLYIAHGVVSGLLLIVHPAGFP
jgi:hypothetical protein